MQSSSFLDRLFNGFKLISESQAVDDYKQTSEVFKKIIKAAEQPGVSESHKQSIQKIVAATTFEEMLHYAKRFVPTDTPVALKYTAIAACAVGGFFSNVANFGYYALQLHEDIVEYAVKNGYLIREEKTNTQNI